MSGQAPTPSATGPALGLEMAVNIEKVLSACQELCDQGRVERGGTR